MKSQLNFKVIKNGIEHDMHEMGIWVSSFHIHSPDAIRNKVNVPGMPGAHLVSTDEGERSVNIAMQLEADNVSDFEGLKSQVFDLFYNKTEITIIRDLTPDREIKVYQEGSYDINNITTEDGEFELFLTMANPYSYGPVKPINFQSDLGIVENNGTAEADPIFELEVIQDTTFVQIANADGEYMMIGEPASVEDTVFEPMTTILRDTMQTTVGWAPGTTVDGGRLITGEMDSNGEYFYPKSFGTGLANNYHGPALKKSISEPIQDFRAEALVRFSNMSGQVGRLEFYLLDASNNIVGRFGLYDSAPNRASVRANARVGDAAQGIPITDTTAEYNPNWNNFFGLARLERIENEWFAYFTLIDPVTWKYHTTHRARIETTNFNQPITQIQIYMAGYTAPWGALDTIPMRVEDLWVRRINKQQGIPYIAHAGDIITFDHAEDNILINGESIFGYENEVRKDFGASYFKLKPGQNQLFVFPENTFGNKSVRFRERFR